MHPKEDRKTRLRIQLSERTPQHEKSNPLRILRHTVTRVQITPMTSAVWKHRTSLIQVMRSADAQ